MQPASGKRDTLITFQAASTSQDSTYGTPDKTWADVSPNEWAEVLDLLTGNAESIEPGIDMSKRPCRIRTLYRAGITPQHRVKIGSRILEIKKGPIVLGSPARPEGLEMICIEFSSLGDAP